MGIDRGPRTDSARREALANAGQRARDRASSGGYEVRSGGFRPRSTSRRPGRRWSLVLASAAVLLIVAWFAFPPLLGGLFRALAEGNPDLMRLGFVADAVATVMDDRPDTPAGTDPTPVDFVVQPGASSREITEDLVERELVTDRLAFSWVLASEGGFDGLRFGRHLLNRTMTPRQVAGVLQGEPVAGDGGVSVALNRGLRLEQIVAYLQTLPFTGLDIEEFYGMAKDPPQSIREKFGWLDLIPEGRSVEGFLGSGVFDAPEDINATGMLELLLQRWQDSPSFALIDEAQSHGLDFYETVVLASIVEREAILDEDRPLIAGVYQNRVDGLDGVKVLNAEPVLIYAKDSIALREQHISEWPQYYFWTLDGLGSAQDFEVPVDLAGYQVWHSRGLPPGPISTPGLASLQAALNPNTADGYLYFLAKGDGSNGHVFAHKYEEHLHNIDIYIGGGSPTPDPSPAVSPQ
ncbi:MAG: endolytic transglycosylase MltG [Chloroflexota bacterium]